MASLSGTLYIGLTNNLERRVKQHKERMADGFTKKYGCNKLEVILKIIPQKYQHNG